MLRYAEVDRSASQLIIDHMSEESQKEKPAEIADEVSSETTSQPEPTITLKSSEFEQIKSELEKHKKEYLYAMAELDNFRKQMIKERSDLRKYGAERLIVELLNVLDVFETALATEINMETLNDFRKGIDLTATQLKTTLQKFGVEELPALGQQFDPAMHEALSSEESESVPAGHISKVFKKPYKLYERTIRPAQVVVAKAKA